jgi:hypothetical protein
MYNYHHHHHHFKSRFHKWLRTWNIWPFELGLPHSTCWCPYSSIFLQTTLFHFSSGLSNILWCVCVFVCVYTCNIFFILIWFHSLTIVNRAAINIGKQIFLLYIDL